MSETKKNVFTSILRYFKDIRSELKKVSWPTKQQVFKNTGIVLVFVAIISAIIFAVDFGFSNLLTWVLSAF